MIKLPILWCSERHRERMTKELKNKVIYVRLDFGSGDFCSPGGLAFRGNGKIENQQVIRVAVWKIK